VDENLKKGWIPVTAKGNIKLRHSNNALLLYFPLCSSLPVIINKLPKPRKVNINSPIHVKHLFIGFPLIPPTLAALLQLSCLDGLELPVKLDRI